MWGLGEQLGWRTPGGAGRWGGGEGLGAQHPPPAVPHVLFSWLSLKRVLYNRLGTVGKALSWALWTLLLNSWIAGQSLEAPDSSLGGERCRWSCRAWCLASKVGACSGAGPYTCGVKLVPELKWKFRTHSLCPEHWRTGWYENLVSDTLWEKTVQIWFIKNPNFPGCRIRCRSQFTILCSKGVVKSQWVPDPKAFYPKPYFSSTIFTVLMWSEMSLSGKLHKMTTLYNRKLLNF